MTNTNLYDVLVWPTAHALEGAIADELAMDFDLLGLHRLEWDRSSFESNINRFYGFNVSMRDKATCRTAGQPLLIVLRDPAPRFGINQTSRGSVLVNLRMLAFKQKYRALSCAPFGIYGAVTTREAERDLLMLLGVPASQYRPGLANARTQEVHGASGWTSAAQLCAALRLYTPVTVLACEADIIHLLAGDAARCRLLAGSDSPWIGGNRVVMSISQPGDGSLPVLWQQALLREYEMDKGGLPVPKPEHRLPLALHRQLARLPPMRGEELSRMAEQAGLPAIDYGDRELAAAALNGMLSDMNLIEPVPDAGMVSRALRQCKRALVLAGMSGGTRAA